VVAIESNNATIGNIGAVEAREWPAAKRQFERVVAETISGKPNIHGLEERTEG
jgi:hypothetical protein